MKDIAILILVLLLLSLSVWFMEKHDKKINEAAVKYEACVRQEYNMTPFEWYSEHFEYPPCPITK